MEFFLVEDVRHYITLVRQLGRILPIRAVQLWAELLNLFVAPFPFVENKMVIVMLSSLVML